MANGRTDGRGTSSPSKTSHCHGSEPLSFPRSSRQRNENLSILSEVSRQPRGAEWLWHPKMVVLYKLVLQGSDSNATSREAAIGALQNITAGEARVRFGYTAKRGLVLCGHVHKLPFKSSGTVAHFCTELHSNGASWNHLLNALRTLRVQENGKISKDVPKTLRDGFDSRCLACLIENEHPVCNMQTSMQKLKALKLLKTKSFVLWLSNRAICFQQF